MNSQQNMAETAYYSHACSIKCVSWSAVVLGAVVAIGLSFLLNLFSTSIGLSIYHISTTGANTLTVSGMLGFAIGIIATMFFSGWVAGYFGRAHCRKKYCGAIYGFSTWCVALILMVVMSMSIAKFVTTYTNYLANNTIVISKPVVGKPNSG